MIPTKIPLEPTHPSGMPVTVVSPDMISYGMIKNQHTMAIAAPNSLSTFICSAKE